MAWLQLFHYQEDRMVELLAPAGSYESLRAAVNAGADAVYIGGSRFGARAYADNPDEDALLDGIRYCHLHGKKLYMTVNTLLKEEELEQELYSYLFPYYQAGLDGVIVQDFGVVQYLAEHFPKLPVHASTQMTITGCDSVRVLQRHGVTRVVPARELSLDEVQQIIEETGIEVETFVHGALCYCYSGQCLFSSMIGGRSGNRGRCAQPCRLPFRREDGERNMLGSQKYLLSMKDLCTLELLPEIVGAGIASLKIEGRMKRPEYTAGVVSIYRKYLDRLEQMGGKPKHWKADPEDLRTLMDLYNRGGFTEGYYHQHNGPKMMSMERPNHFGTEAARLILQKKGGVQAQVLEYLYPGDVLESHDTSFSMTVKEEIKTGGRLVLPKNGMRPNGNELLYRTKSELLLRKLREAYVEQEQKIKINGVLKISAWEPAMLELYCGTVRGEVRSEEIAQPAKSRPVDAVAARKQIEKTGNTMYTFEQLTVSVENGLFFPLRALNELRRQGIEALTEKLLSRYTRSGQPQQERGELMRADVEKVLLKQKGMQLTVSVQTADQLEAVIRQPKGIAGVYVDLLVAGTGRYRIDVGKLRALVQRIKEAGLSCWLNFPPVFRTQDRRLLELEAMQALLPEFDGFLLHTLDELGYVQLRGRDGQIWIGDDTFYAYNGKASGFLVQEGIGRRTLPAELNFKELMRLCSAGPDGETELVVYGRQALMHSAQCVTKNTSVCTQMPECGYLKDRKNAEFPVVNRCVTCCNTIYNSVPLDLSGCRKEIEALSPDFVRAVFTVESGEETAAVLDRLKQLYVGGRMLFAPDGQDGTRGHFRRGVE